MSPANVCFYFIMYIYTYTRSMSITGPNILKSMSIIIWELFKMLLIIVLSSVQLQPVLKGIT